MKKNYCRKIILSDLPVDGFYRFGNLFQLLPPDKTAPTIQFGSKSHHPLIIEYCFDTPEVKYLPTEENRALQKALPDWITIGEASNEKLTELLRILNIVTNNRYFIYDYDQAWFIPLGKNEKVSDPPSCVWGQNFYDYPEFNREITGFSKPYCLPMNIESSQTYYNRFGPGVGNKVDLPESIDDTLIQYFQLDNNARDAFISSAILFSNGLEICTKMQSLSFAAFISSIETLANYDNRNTKVEKCEVCGQDKHSATKKFKSFLQKYGSPDPSFKKDAEKLYKIRSEILHSGSLFLGDINLIPWGLKDHAKMNKDKYRRNVIQITRICLVNWLITRDH